MTFSNWVILLISTWLLLNWICARKGDFITSSFIVSLWGMSLVLVLFTSWSLHKSSLISNLFQIKYVFHRRNLSMKTVPVVMWAAPAWPVARNTDVVGCCQFAAPRTTQNGHREMRGDVGSSGNKHLTDCILRDENWLQANVTNQPWLQSKRAV